VDFQHADDEDLETELRRQAPRGSVARAARR